MQRATDVQLHYVVDHPKGECVIQTKLPLCNTSRDKTFTHFSSYYSAIQRDTVLQLHYVVDHPKVGERLIKKKLRISKTFREKRHLLILEAMTQLCKELQICIFTMW